MNSVFGGGLAAPAERCLGSADLGCRVTKSNLRRLLRFDDDDEHDAGYYTRVVSVLLSTSDLLNLVDA